MLLLFLVPMLYASRPGDFNVLGPGGGGAMFHPMISPHDPNTALVACDMSGGYVTHDGGKSWRMFNLRGVINFFAFDPVNSKTLYAGTRALWRSTDDGETWNLVWPKAESIREIEMNNDHAEEWIKADGNALGAFVTLAVDQKDPKLMVAAGVNQKQFALWLSRSAGESWEKLTDLQEAPRGIFIDPGSPKGKRDIYVTSDHGLMVRHEGKWQPHGAPKDVVFNDVSVGFSTASGAVVYATSPAGLHISRDGGLTWASGKLFGDTSELRAVATSLNHPEVAYVSYKNVKQNDKSWFGVARTGDLGSTWQLVWKEAEHTTGANIHDTWLTHEFGPDWGENPLAMTVADQDPNLSYTTDFGRTMMTSDGGKNWYATYSQRVPEANWTSTGLDVTSSYTYVFDPFDAKRHFIPNTDIGLIRSEDGGRSWTRSAKGIPDRWVNTTYWMVFDPAVKGRVWAVTSSVHDLPRPKMWRRTPVSSFQGGVCLSNDGGRTWIPSNKGMPETATTHVLLDPTSSPEHRVLYVAAMGTGVYKSTDGGVSWVAKNKGITQKEPFAWRLTRAEDGTLYVIIARRSEDGSIGTSGDGALYRSTDGAENWTSVSLPQGVNAPTTLAIDPRDPKRLYLATWARSAGVHGDGGGLFFSTDGGKSWNVMMDRDRHLYDIAIDPRNPDVLYATGFESSVWRSADKGARWARIPGFNFKWAHRVIPDPQDASKIYVTTFGGGVWHGSIDGEDKPLDIATPVMFPGK